MGTGKKKVNDAIIAKLVSDFGYKEDRAVEVVDKLQKSNPAVQEFFEKWSTTGELDAEMIVEGYTLQTLVAKRGFNPINACLILDRLIRDPKRMVRSLSRGYDHFLGVLPWSKGIRSLI
jgi:hypothetical protein